MTVCEICKNSTGNKSYVVREMMFGFREDFEYFECAECGCLQIKEIPANLSKYYPETYYSFQDTFNSKQSFLETFLKRRRMNSLLYGPKSIGILLSKILSKIYGSSTPDYYDGFRKIKLTSESKILDVGCGAGGLLLRMQAEGFTNLTGADPYIKDDIIYPNGVKVFKKELYDLDQKFDFIMLNHSFEHMPKPLFVLKEIYRLLKNNRYALIRVPLVSSFAWREYGVNWVQIDAPRHFFLHTTKSIQILAKQVGFQIADIIFDSHAYQFWGSEQLLKDIPVKDSKSYAVNPEKSIFSKQQIDAFNAKSIQLNKDKDGDAAGFYLYKA